MSMTLPRIHQLLLLLRCRWRAILRRTIGVGGRMSVVGWLVVSRRQEDVDADNQQPVVDGHRSTTLLLSRVLLLLRRRWRPIPVQMRRISTAVVVWSTSGVDGYVSMSCRRWMSGRQLSKKPLVLTVQYCSRAIPRVAPSMSNTGTNASNIGGGTEGR